MFIDCSRTLTNGMPAFRLKNEDGSFQNFTVEIKPFLTRSETKPKFSNDVSFEITQVSFQCVVGTYLDSPFHRYEGMKDISQITLDQVISEGVVFDARGLQPWDSFTPKPMNNDLGGKIVLINFGWDKHFDTEKYHSYPYISEEFISYLVDQHPLAVGVDTINIDNSNDLTRPAHTNLLKENILIIENLVNLDLLLNKVIRFYAIPVKLQDTASFPVRAFAEIVE